MQAMDRPTQWTSDPPKAEPGGGFGRLPPGQTRHLGSDLAICTSFEGQSQQAYVPPMGAMMTLASGCAWAVGVHMYKLEWICM